jgi:uncharacterized protein (TIGR03118 family)
MRDFMRTVLFGIVSLLALGEARADTVAEIDLVSNQPGVARLQDPSLVNAWGVSYGGSSPFWVSNNGTGTSTLYTVNASDIPTKNNLTVKIPGDGTVTGQANTGGGLNTPFNGDNFLFVSEDGTISGWRGALGTNAEVLQSASTANVYKGSAFGNANGFSYLYAANFRTGNIDVLKGSAGAPDLTGKFTDPTLPAGFAPFNIQNIGGTLYVSYAMQDPNKHDEVAGAGLGYVNKFDLNGNLLGRVASQGTLNAPWGMAIASSTFGSFAGDLLVGNFGDGMISAYNLATNTFIGLLKDSTGKPVAIDGLWALIPGNGGSGGNKSEIYFSAGPDGESNGLFGALQAVPEPSEMVLISMILVTGLGVKFGRRLVVRRPAVDTGPR